MINRHYFKNMVPGSTSLGSCVEVTVDDFVNVITAINNNFSCFKHNRDIFDIIFYYNDNNGEFIGYVKEYRI